MLFNVQFSIAATAVLIAKVSIHWLLYLIYTINVRNGILIATPKLIQVLCLYHPQHVTNLSQSGKFLSQAVLLRVALKRVLCFFPYVALSLQRNEIHLGILQTLGAPTVEKHVGR